MATTDTSEINARWTIPGPLEQVLKRRECHEGAGGVCPGAIQLRHQLRRRQDGCVGGLRHAEDRAQQQA